MKISKEQYLSFYRMMFTIRQAEEALVVPILDGSVRCPVHLYSGQEAIATGLCANLQKTDYVFGNHRSHGHYLAKGGSLYRMFAEIYGKSDGCCKGRGGSMHLIDPENGVMGIAPIVAGTISLALGASLASHIRGDKRVTVSFFGDGATGEGVLYESLNFASLKKLPIIFACENNLYSTHLPIREIRANPDIYKIAEPFNIKTYQVDGNDVMAVYEVSKNAVEYCRNNEGPVFIEFKTYRFRGHVGPDDNIQGTHTDIRPAEEVKKWFEKDPIVLLKKYLLGHDYVSASELESIETAVKAEVAEALQKAQQAERPERTELTRYVYA